MTNWCALRKRLPDPKTTTAVRISPTAPNTNAPTVVGLTRLPMAPLWFSILVAARKESPHAMVGAMGEQLLGVAARDHRAAFRVEEDAVVPDCKDTCQFVCHHDDRRAEVVANIKNHVDEQ